MASGEAYGLCMKWLSTKAVISHREALLPARHNDAPVFSNGDQEKDTTVESRTKKLTSRHAAHIIVLFRQVASSDSETIHELDGPNQLDVGRDILDININIEGW